jgi:ABC-type phosphate transport system substrate-binding protein
MRYGIFPVVFLLAVSGLAQAAEYIIIANTGVAESALSQQDAQSIFLGKKTQWADGSRIHPVTLETGEVHKAFLKDVARQTPSQFATHWKRMVFTGRGAALQTFATEKETVGHVAKTAGAIGYVGPGVSTEGVKTLTVK